MGLCSTCGGAEERRRTLCGWEQARNTAHGAWAVGSGRWAVAGRDAGGQAAEPGCHAFPQESDGAGFVFGGSANSIITQGWGVFSLQMATYSIIHGLYKINNLKIRLL